MNGLNIDLTILVGEQFIPNSSKTRWTCIGCYVGDTGRDTTSLILVGLWYDVNSNTTRAMTFPVADVTFVGKIKP
jgi:hypothetical protein